MEDSGNISNGASKHIPELCSSLIKAGEFLVENLDQISVDVVHDLQLLTYGPLLRGSRNTRLGSTAEKEVKDVIQEILSEKATIQEAERSLRFVNIAGDAVQFIFAGDPDVSVFITAAGKEAAEHLSIEIKGGTDFSNIHNRLGEAEKSHIKAKAAGFSECWTIIAVELDVAEARRDSPTTDNFFYMEHVKDKRTSMYAEFKQRLLKEVGL